MKKKRISVSTIVLVLIFFVGLSVLLYPTISNYINQLHASRAVVNYDEAMNSMDEEDYQPLWKAAKKYNKQLAKETQSFVTGAVESEEYASLLNITGDGMIGYVTIQRLGVQLPIYHGTAESTLDSGVGHLEGSSLPIGGKSTHAVLTGHRGLPSAKLFTNLDQMEVGDTFTVTVFNETLTYQVDQIKIVLPQEVEDLTIVDGEDYVTLVTCTPYAVNTHRLLVRGVRTDAPNETRITADAMQIDPVIVAPSVAAPILLCLLIWLLASGKRKKNHRERKDNENDAD